MPRMVPLPVPGRNKCPYRRCRIPETPLKPAAYPLLTAAALLLAAAKPPEKPIAYKMTPVTQPDGSRALDVEMRFRGEADGETNLFLPSVWAGSSELWRHVTRLEIGGARSVGGSFDRPVVRHRPGARLRVRYRVVSAYSEDPGFAYEKARPMVRTDWFFVHGETVFATHGCEGRPPPPV